MNKLTENNNILSDNIDSLSIIEILKVINNEDNKVPLVIKKSIPEISFLIDDVVKTLNNNGRLFYVGCGTSGRLGVLDAVECPPTFTTSSDMIQAIIAGGSAAMYKSVENAEDSEINAIKIIKKKILSNDIVIAISASGTPNFIVSALKESNKIGAKTCLITCNDIKKTFPINHLIKLIVGPEIISGSTRMKAGTATKMVLNMISTTAMIKINKTYGNLMVDLKVSNDKLKKRAVCIIMQLTNLGENESIELLRLAHNNVKAAIVMNIKNLSYKKSLQMIEKTNGSLRSIIG